MKDRIMKALFVLMALSLVICLIASGIVFDSSSSYAATSSLKWTQISIPDEGDRQLYPGYDIGPMAVSPDGSTVFAAVQNELVLTDWALMKSTNGGFGWQETGLADAMAAAGDTSDVVAVLLSPSWGTDGIVFAATEKGVYYSDDRGNIFDDLATVPGTGGAADITSMALGRTDGKIVIAVGTSDGALGGDVYMLDMAIWNAQAVGAYDVLAVGLSPSYASDETIIAVVTDATQTRVRTKRGADDWALTIPDAVFTDEDSLNFVSDRACIALPSDYNAISQSSRISTCFVGLSAAGPRGDVFRVDGGWLSTPTSWEDLNVRNMSAGDPSETNIWSIALSGSTSDMRIIVGTEALDYNEPPSPHGQFMVYNSVDGGDMWVPRLTEYLSCKQPTGEAKATVVMTPYMAYTGTFGDQSAVSASIMSIDSGGAFSSWNQRGLIDTVIDEITDASPSEGYYSDGTIFITTVEPFGGDASLWRTQTEGRIWERLYCSTLTINTSSGTPSCIFNTVSSIGDAIILAELGGTGVIPSIDGGTTFRFDPWNAAIGNTPADITAFVVADESTYYAGDANGVVRRWTDDSGTWATPSDSDIPSADTVVDLVLTDGDAIYAGTNNGGVYKAGVSGFTFTAVDPENDQSGTTGDIVHVAPDLYDGSYVYAGIQGGVATQGIWRFDQSDDEAEWEQMAGAADVGDISSIACDSENGILYAISSSTGTGWRSVNPTNTEDELEFDEMFEEMKDGLGPGDSVLRGLKVVTNPTILFAVGGPSYTQLWTTSDEMARMRLLAPEDGSESGIILEDEAFLGRAIVRLEWKEIEGANEYEVQLAFDEDFISPVDDSYYDGGTHDSTGLLKMVYPWLGTKYYWRVRVVDPYMSQWSEVWSFVTPLGPALSKPTLLSPKEGTIGVSLMPLLQWNSSVAATGYELILTKNCDWEYPALNLSGDDAISDTAYQLTFALEEDTDYCWKVRGVSDITHSPWSDSISFVTGSTVWTEDEGLPVWVWVIIALSAVLMLSIIVLIVHSRGD